MNRRSVIFYVFSLWAWLFMLWQAVVPAAAQEWCRYASGLVPSHEWSLRWIACPTADEFSHVWFRQSYVTLRPGDEPVKARLTVASPGSVRVYVNECNVGTAQWYAPSRPVTFDITPYLEEDTNVVAVLCAPSESRSAAPRLALSYYGVSAAGRPFSYEADSTWLCRISPASGRLPSGGEWTDGREAGNSWLTTCFDAALWLSAEAAAVPDGSAAVPDCSAALPTSVRLTHVSGANDSDVEGRTVVCTFTPAVVGQVRLTLRGACCGETIRYGRNLYICNGELDEQASPLFSVDSFRRVVVSGDRFFRRDQLWSVEALSLQRE